MTRTIIVLAGYLVLATAFWFATPAPQPIKFVPVTEAQIRAEVCREQNQKALEAKRKKYERAVLTARLVYRANRVRETYAEITAKTALRFGLSPRLLAGVIVVESHGNPNAKDGLGSIGLMQVNSKVWGHKNDLTNPEINLTIGGRILANYVHQFGVVEGLHHYNGYSEVHGHVYVNKVLTVAQIVVM